MIKLGLNKESLFYGMISIIVAVLSHSFFIYVLGEGVLMAGPGDGMSQMLPFKQLLYEQYAQGNFFYNNAFGLGGGTYSQLSYYYATSIFFIASYLVTFVLEICGIIDEANVFYWGKMIIVVSIFRMIVMMAITMRFFILLGSKRAYAFIGAVVYSTSIIYFRHVTYWEFFADAMVWLPLLLIGVEKIMTKRGPWVFIMALAICLFDNFYFAYINVLLAGIYIVLRWICPLKDDEAPIWQQIKLYTAGGFTAFGISAISFIPAVYGYVNNHRIPYEGDIPLFATVDNPLLDGRVIAIPILTVICLFLFRLYRDKRFMFFAIMTVILFFLHFSPLVGSIFNGFSAPQFRWEYFLALTSAGVIVFGLHQLATIAKGEKHLAIGATIILYVTAYYADPLLPFTTWQGAYLLYGAILMLLIFALFSNGSSQKKKWIIPITVIVISIVSSNFFQYVKLYEKGNVQDSTIAWMKSDAYMGEDQLQLINQIKADEGDAFYRIDWMTNKRNNTPIVQDFRGFSAYSSILNKHLLYFYLYDLEIDMKRESVSRYGTLGNRVNLFSLLAGKYYLTTKDDENVPYGMIEKYTSGQYVVYENPYILPFVKVTDKVYEVSSLKDQPALVREWAMLNGIILNQADSNENIIPPTRKEKFTIQTNGASFEDDHLTVTEKSGGLTLQLEDISEGAGDFYLRFELRRKNENKHFLLRVNEYETERKRNDSIYKTGVDDLTIRVKRAEELVITLPQGSYEIKNIAIYAEDYATLENAKELSEQQVAIPFTYDKNRLAFTVDHAEEGRYATIPVPFEKGWQVKVNGQKQTVLQANYAFLGVELQTGKNVVQFVYYPPFFFLSLFMTIGTIISLLIVYIRSKIRDTCTN